MCECVHVRSPKLTIDLYSFKSLQGEAQLKMSFHRLPYLFHTAVGSKKEKRKRREGAL